MANYTIRTQPTMTATDYIKLGGAAIGATAVVFFGIKLYQYIKKTSSENKELKQYGKEVNKSELMHTESEFVTMADRIDQALNSTFNDDEQTVYQILSSLKNSSEWNKLIKTFGVRKRWAAFGQVTGTLIDWLQDAFNGSELQKVRDILSKINVNF